MFTRHNSYVVTLCYMLQCPSLHVSHRLYAFSLSYTPRRPQANRCKQVNYNKIQQAVSKIISDISDPYNPHSDFTVQPR